MAMAMEMLLPALALAMSSPVMIDTRGDDTPTMSVSPLRFPDDVVYGSRLAYSCRTPCTGTEISVDGRVSLPETIGGQ